MALVGNVFYDPTSLANLVGESVSNVARGTTGPTNIAPAPTSAAPAGVYGYWAVQDQKTGHVALFGKAASSSPSHTPVVPANVKKAMGAGPTDYFTAYYLGGDPKNLQTEVDKALNSSQIQASTDQIPTDFTKLVQSGIQAINFDLLNPIGTNKNQYQQGLNQAAQGAYQATTQGAGVASGIWEWVTTPANWLRILKYIAGAVLIFFGLKELTGAHVPAAAKQAVAAGALL